MHKKKLKNVLIKKFAEEIASQSLLSQKLLLNSLSHSF